MNTTAKETAAIINVITDAVLVVDHAGVVLFANEVAHQLLERPELTGKNCGLPLDDTLQTIDVQIVRKSGLAWAQMRAAATVWSGQPCHVLTLTDITQRKQAEEKIQRLSQLYAALSQCNHGIIHCIGEEELLPQICHVAVHWGGMRMAWVGMIDTETRMLRPAASFGDDTGFLQDIKISIADDNPFGHGQTGSAIREDRPYWCQDFMNDPLTAPWREIGAGFGLKAVASLPLHKAGVVIGAFILYATESHIFDESVQSLLVEMAEDISFALDNYARESQLQLAATVFEHSNEGIMITDADNNIVSVNPTFTRITGYSADEVIGQNPRILKSDRHSADFFQGMWDTLRSTGRWQSEIYNRRKNGELYVEWLDLAAVRNANNKITQYIGAFTDLSTHKSLEERIEQLSHYDALTGLPNLQLFENLLALMMGKAKSEQLGVAVMQLDIVNFHDIVDQFGFEVGDQTIKTIAERLQSAMGKDGLVTRTAKDNFAIAHAQNSVSLELLGASSRLLEAIKRPVKINDIDIHLDANIGISLYPDDGNSVMDLLQMAGIALSLAKSKKKTKVCSFEKEMNAQLQQKLLLTHDLRRALEQDEFELYYQPQINLANGLVTGLEALIRWNHPIHGLMAPGRFIPLAEESGLIQAIGDWVLTRAVRQAREWADAGFRQLCVAVNTSASQYESRKLIEHLAALLEETGLPPSSIELELTEGVLMQNVSNAILMLAELKAMGVSLSIDDFGTGYSSLVYLQQFSVDKLKIDKSFIDNITTNANNAAIVQATIAMSRSLGLTVIAEGVETEGQANYLRMLHCDEMQGYLFSRPVPAKEIPQLLDANQKIPSVDVLKDGLEKRVLLLVDDEPNILSALKRVLRADRYKIFTASSGEQALEILAQHRAGVIVSDQRMHGMSGIELFSRVKRMHPNAIRIILSGYTEVNTITDAVNKGEVYKFLTKPWDEAELRKNIKIAFNRYEDGMHTNRRQGDRRNN